MYKINEDLSIYVTRGDTVLFDVKANTEDGTPVTFMPGDLVRIKVYQKKNAANVVLQKDFHIPTATQKVQIYLSKEDTKIGEIINKPVTYWYSVALINPDNEEQTIIGYDEEAGAKTFVLLPEGGDKQAEDNEEEVTPPESVDNEIDINSTLPVSNQAVARAILRLEAGINALKDRYVTPQFFGAVGDGEADDTEAIKKAINELGDGVTTLYLPAGTYLVSEDIPLVSNMTLVGDGNNSVIKRLGNGLDKYNVILCNGIDNVTIKNIHIQGDRDEHTETTGEWGMCIGLYGTSNVTIKDCKLTDAWGDGVYLGTLEEEHCTNTIIDGCLIDNNRRQGISVINSDRLWVRNCVITNTNGTLPEGGIDFEANYATDICKNNIIENCIFDGNNGGSIIVGNQTIPYEIIVSDCRTTDRVGVYIYGTSVEGVRGYLTIQNCDFKNVVRCIDIERKSASGLFVKIRNCDLSASASNGICVEYNSNTDGVAVVGGLRVLGCSLDNPNSSTDPIRIINDKDGGTYNDIVIDSTIETSSKYNVYIKSNTTGSAKVNVGKKRSVKVSMELSQYYVCNQLDMNSENANLRLTCRESFPYGCPVTVRKTSSANTLELYAENGTFPQYGSVQSLEVKGCYEEVTIIHEAAGVWSIKDATTKGVLSSG